MPFFWLFAQILFSRPYHPHMLASWASQVLESLCVLDGLFPSFHMYHITFLSIFLTSCGHDSDHSWLLSQRRKFTHPAESWTSYKWLMRSWFANTISGSYQEDSNVNTYQLQRNWFFFFFLNSNNSIIRAGFYYQSQP